MKNHTAAVLLQVHQAMNLAKYNCHRYTKKVKKSVQKKIWCLPVNNLELMPTKVSLKKD